MTQSALKFITALLAFLAVVVAQDRFCDGPSNVCFTRISAGGASVGFVAPNGSPDEFLGIITAPTSLGYVGISLGGAMTNSLLLVGWTDGNRGIVSPRFAEDYVPPTPYSGPRITVYPAPFSGRNGSQQRIIYRCQGCTSWRGGGNLNLGSMGIAWATSSTPVSNPGDPNSSLRKHTQTGSGSLSAARDSNYSAALARLAGGGAPASSTPPASKTTSVAGRVTGSSSAGGGGSSTTGSVTATLSASSGSVSTTASASTATDSSSLSVSGSETLTVPSTGIPIPTESTTSGADRSAVMRNVIPLMIVASGLMYYI